MSKNNKNAAPNKPLTRPKAGAFNTTLHGFFSVVAMMVDRLGWGGALIVLVFFFIQYNGTTEQKQKIIDKFVLGKELDLFCSRELMRTEILAGVDGLVNIATERPNVGIGIIHTTEPFAGKG